MPDPRSGPPFDGIACPMCPIEWRGLAATAYNLCNRLNPCSVDSLCRVGSKVHDLRAAVDRVVFAPGDPVELRKLYEACRKVSECKTWAEVFALEDELKAASLGVEPLSDAHFANPMHSHGRL